MADVQTDKKVYKMHAELCKALANPIRLRILNLLGGGEKSVSELVTLTGAPQATVSRHLAVLRQKRLVSTRKDGVNVFYKIANPKIIKACDLIREVLSEQIAEMEALIQEAR